MRCMCAEEMAGARTFDIIRSVRLPPLKNASYATERYISNSRSILHNTSSHRLANRIVVACIIR